MSFWENVENIREYKNIPRKELAYKADFSLNSISTGIARDSIPLADVACRIANVLGVSVEFLVTGKTSKSGTENLHEDAKIEKQIDIKKANLAKYMDKYAQMMEEFSRLSAPMQKAISDMIHLAAK
ncbi:MAG: helix-turn-helix domain containing protein [Treponemataceae bacterium]|nr:helix-turn-helix domain containing protein [Treponemataceae bacterium]